MSHPTDLESLKQEFLGRPEGKILDGALVVRPSLRAALARAILAFLTIAIVSIPILVGVLAGGDEPIESWMDVAIVVIDIGFQVIVPLLLAFAPAIQLVFTRYVFDDEGIHERTQILTKTEKRVQWGKVTALRHRRTLLDRMLGIERLDVIAYGARGTTLHLVGLRAAPELRDMVGAQMRKQATVERLFQND